MGNVTKKDIIGMIGLIKANYPYAYKDVEVEDMKMLQETWYRSFAKYPKQVVGAAFQKAIETCKMPPTIADLMERINEFEDANTPTESELWAGLEKAVRQTARVTYFGNQPFYDAGELVNPQQKLNEIFNCLDPLLKEYIGNPETLKSISRLDTLDFEKARFLKVLPTIKQRQKIRNEINPNILKLVSGDTLRLEDKRGEE